MSTLLSGSLADRRTPPVCSARNEDRELERQERVAIQAEGNGPADPFKPDLRHARLYIESLTGSADTCVTFQTFDDSEAKDRSLARILHGTLTELAGELARLNEAGAGVFITVNATDLQGREASNIIAVRAIFADFDHGAPNAFALDPSFTVHSARGPHAYWVLTPGLALADFELAQRRLAAFYGSDPKIHDLPRVMRLPGFFHRKGVPFFVTFEGASDRRYAMEEILAAHPVNAASPHWSLAKQSHITPSSVLAGVPEGERDDTLFRYACSLRARRIERAEAETLVLSAARNCKPAFPDAAALEKVEGAWKHQAGTTQETGTLEFRRLSEVSVRTQEWLWKPRIPIGTLTMMDGDPEKAKSTILLDIAARGSRQRPFPDEQPSSAPFRTVILSAEDSAESVIRPRFNAFGGDPQQVWIVGSIRRQQDSEGRLLDLTADLPALESRILEVRPNLVIVDPITAYLGDIDSFKDSAVRRAIGPLASLAERISFALVVVRHLNKNVSYSDVLYRGGGSIGFIGAARSALMAIADPDEEGRLLLAHYKCNVARKAPTLAYRVSSSPTDPDVPVIEWLGTDPRSARQLHEAGKETADDKSVRGDARHLLREILAEGELKAEDVAKEAKGAGVSPRTLQRAATELKVKKRKEGFRPSVWYWSLP